MKLFKFFEFIDEFTDILEAKSLLFGLITACTAGFMGWIGFGDGPLLQWIALKSWKLDYFIISSIGQLVFLLLWFAYFKEKGLKFKNNLKWYERFFWNIVKVPGGGFLGLFLTDFLATKMFTVFIDYREALAFLIGVLAGYAIRFLEKYLKIKEKQLDDKTKNTFADDGGDAPKDPPK